MDQWKKKMEIKNLQGDKFYLALDFLLLIFFFFFFEENLAFDYE